jgi:transcription elongation factor GreA-like protein
VVFGNKAVLKDVSHNKDVYVVNTKRLTKLIAQLENEFRVSYNLINQVEIIDTFYSFNITDKKERKAHVKRLKKKYSGH